MCSVLLGKQRISCLRVANKQTQDNGTWDPGLWNAGHSLDDSIASAVTCQGGKYTFMI